MNPNTISVSIKIAKKRINGNFDTKISALLCVESELTNDKLSLNDFENDIPFLELCQAIMQQIKGELKQDIEKFL